MNTIYTAEEYMAQGFTAKEVPMITRHDELFNRFVRGGNTLPARQYLEMMELVKRLGL